MSEIGFEMVLRVCRIAFERRLADAREKTEQLRDKYLAEELELRRRLNVVAAFGLLGAAHRCPETGERIIVDLDGSVINAKFVRRQADELNQKAMRLIALLTKFANANLNREEGPTPEAVVKDDEHESLARLVEKRTIEPWHEEAGALIAAIWWAVTKASRTKTSTVEPKGGIPKRSGRAEYQFMSDAMADLHHNVYLPWVTEMDTDKRHNLPLVMDVVVDDYSLHDACKRRRVGWKRGGRQLRGGLGLFLAYKDNQPRKVA